MALLTFTDDEEVEWRVWATVPSAGARLDSVYGDGWLTFESALGKFRLAPVLDGWAEFSSEKLRLLLRLARARGISVQDNSSTLSRTALSGTMRDAPSRL